MGLAWCRERVEQAQNSKSPVDRILVCCSNVIKPKTPYSHSQGKIVNDFVYKGMRTKNLGISAPVPIHAVPPSRNRVQKYSDWHSCTLSVPDSEDYTKPPIPPPRKKRKRKINSADVLNSQLPELHSPSYVIYSENLLNKKLGNVDASETNDVIRPLEKTYRRERAYVKSSGNHRGRKLKGETHSREGKEKKIKNDNEKKTEEKIKHVSSVSLPNYNELVKPGRKIPTADRENGDDKNGNQSVGLKQPRRNSSSISLPGEGSNSILSSLSEATIHRLETYMKRCRSFGSLKPQQLLEKLEEFNKTHKSGSESSDSWSGLDDWDLGVIEYCDPDTNNAPPLTPKSTLPPKTTKVSFYPPEEQHPGEKEEEPTKPEVEPEEKTKNPILERCQSVIEGVPLEWFLDPQLRPPAIMPPPPPEPVKYVKTPYPSPEDDEESQTDQNLDTEDHSSLLDILRKYKDDESGEPEVKINVKQLVLERDPASFEDIDLGVSNTNPFRPPRNRSNSLAGTPKKTRSSSIGFENSNQLLEQIRRNSEAIEKEILLKPEEFLQGLRRESLCLSLPEDAFEVFENKRKPSMRESLNEFLGFEKKQEEEKDDGVKEDGEKEEEKKEDGVKEEEKSQLPPPLPLNPPPIVINPPSGDENTPIPNSLVKSNDNPNVI